MNNITLHDRSASEGKSDTTWAADTVQQLRFQLSESENSSQFSPEIAATTRWTYSDYADELRKTDEYRISQRCRKKIEMLFGESKEFMGLARARRRGHRNVLDQCLITAAVQNMKRIISAMDATRPAYRDAQGAHIPTSLLNPRLFRDLYRWFISSFTFRSQYAW